MLVIGNNTARDYFSVFGFSDGISMQFRNYSAVLMPQFKQTLSDNPTEISKYHSEICALADTEKSALGFLPRQAVENAIQRGRVIVSIDQSVRPEKLAGYLLYSGVFPHAKIQQIATSAEYRRRGVGRSLIRKMVEIHERLQFDSISAHIASDLSAALSFYQRNGFKPVISLPGGKSKGRIISVHVLRLRANTLFSYENEKGPSFVEMMRRRTDVAPFYALDLNVYFDLAKDRAHSNAARELFGSAIGHEIRLAVADEFVDELYSTRQVGNADPILELANKLPRMPRAKPDELNSLSEEIRNLVFPDLPPAASTRKRATSDARHLAHAVLARASAFVTRDNAILNARPKLLKAYGIDVVTVDELLELLPNDRDSQKLEPVRGKGFDVEEADVDRINHYLNKFVAPQSVAEVFGRSGDHTVDYHAAVIASDGEDQACAVLISPRNTEPQCKLLVHVRPEALRTHLFADYLLDEMLRCVGDKPATAVELEVLPGQVSVADIATERGFVKNAGKHKLTKIVMGRPVTATNWGRCEQLLRMRTGISIPKEMPPGAGSHRFEVGGPTGEKIETSVRDLEELLGPTLIAWPDRHGVIVPITKSYSEELIGASSQMALDIFPKKDASFLSRRAYVNTPRAASSIRPDMPIFFYESQGNGGAGAVVALARVVDSVIMDASTLPKEIKSMLVVEDANKFSSGDDVLVTSFDNLFICPSRITFRKLQELSAVSRRNLVSAESLPGRLVTKIIDLGWQNE